MSDFTVLALPNDGSEQPAIIVPATRDTPAIITSYEDLNRSVSALQQALAHIGISKGSRVALVLSNSLEFVVVFLAVIRQRAVAAPINPQYKQGEYCDLFGLMQPSLVVTAASTSASPSVLAAQSLGVPVSRYSHRQGKTALEAADENYTSRITAAPVSPLQDIQPTDEALLLYTSGTTGVPKAVMLMHGNLMVAIHIIIDAHKLSSTDRCMLITPLFHVAGIGASLLTTLFSGGCAIIPISLPGAFWQTCRDYGATWFHAVPTLHHLLLSSFPRPNEMPALRFVRSGGSHLSPELFRRLEEEIGAPVLEIYGMTETAPGILCNRLDVTTRRPAHYPIPSTIELRILPHSSGGEVLPLTRDAGVVGEICIRGRNVMSGYVDNPKANAEAFVGGGFFRTGDLGIICPDGYLQLTGRIKEIINKGGEKISPTEIEHIVLLHEAVREAACFRVAEDIYGEDIGLAVALHPGKHLDAIGVKAHVRKRAATFKVPKAVIFIDKVPTNRTGKPRRTFLSEQFAQGSLG